MKPSQPSVTETVVGGESSRASESQSQCPLNHHNTKKKRRCRCLRLDFGHSRNIFVTTFYRIWMYRRRHLFTTLIQLAVPPLMIFGMIMYMGTLLKVEEKDWSRWDSKSEQELLSSICGDACSKPGSRGVITLYMKYDTTMFAKKFETQLRTSLSAYNIDMLAVSDKDGIVKQTIHHHLRNEYKKYVAGIEIQNPEEDPPGSLYGVGDNFELTFTVLMAQEIPEFGFNHASSFFNLDEHQPDEYHQLVGIELAVFSAYRQLLIKERNVTSQIESIDVQPFPYPPHKSHSHINTDGDAWIKHFNTTLTIILVLSMIPTVFTVVEGPVAEKEDGFKLYLQLMGYPRGAYWFSWILNQFLVQCIVVALQVLLLFLPINENTGRLMKHGDWRLWAVILLLYNLSCLTFFVFLAAFFRRGKMATYLVILIWCLFYHVLQSHIPSTLPLLHVYLHSTFHYWHLICLVPSGAVYWAVYALTAITSDTWDTIDFPASNSDFTLLNAIVMMIADFFIYFFLTLYVDNLNPGPFQHSQPWNYFFEGIKPRFIDPLKDFPIEEDPPSKSSVCSHCENCPNVSDSAIEFDKISKKFYVYDGVYGIENVKFTVHTAKITVILGHKDSGRTTLMRLLCGEYSPTSGTASVFGYDVRRDAQKVQSYLSICMEKSLLCEYLTVMEHMQLIGKLKGLSLKDTKKKAKLILESTGLLPQRNDSVWRLVNWQKRVLCVAMAILGSKRILLLDEPTKDLDLDVKRQIWGLLKQLKKNGKTILLLSNNIDEACQIADKIVIMSRGKVAGAGTPARLEQIFESGYHIHMNVIPNANKDEILSFIQKYVPSAKEVEGSLRQFTKAMQISDWDRASQALLQEFTEPSPPTNDNNDETVINVGGDAESLVIGASSEDAVGQQRESTPTIVRLNNDFNPPLNLMKLGISYMLPFQERSSFPKLFNQLDNVSTTLELGVKSYTVEMHDLEETFYKVDDYIDIVNASRNVETEDRESGDFSDIKPLKLPQSAPKFEPLPDHSIEMTFKTKFCTGWTTLCALIAKRFWFIVGNYRHALVQIIGPVLIVLITIYSTSRSFQHTLNIFDVKYNTSKKSADPVAPYRIINDSSLAAGVLDSFQRIISKPPNNIKRLKNLGISEFDTYITEDNRWALHNEIILGADFTKVDSPDKKVTAMFSPGHLHAAPLSVLFMCHTILDFEFPKHNYSFEMNTQALSHDSDNIFLTDKAYPSFLLMQNLDISFTVSIAFSYFIFTSGFAVQPCAERVSRIKRYQLNIIWNILYWTGFAFVDLLLTLIFTTIIASMMYFVPEHGVFKNPEFMILFCITGCLGGYSSTLTAYCLTHYLTKSATSYYVTLSINQVLGLFIFLLYSIFNFDYIGPFIGDIISLCLQCIQPFTLPWNFNTAIMKAFTQGRCLVLNPIVKAEMCSATADGYKDIDLIRGDCCDYRPPDWKFNFIWKKGIKSRLWIDVVFQLSHCVGLCFLLAFMERRRMRRKLLNILIHPEKPGKINNPHDLKSIMSNEKYVETVEESENRDKYFIVRNLGTSTFRRNILHGVTFATEPGKCTVILGPETSGLTALHEIIAGIRPISEGDVCYGGYSLFTRTGRNKLLCQFGFCPSIDVTINKLSGLQLLKLFGRLRGISEKALPTHIDYWVQSLNLKKKIKKRCQLYSSVVRKKLSVAIAAIGNPPVIIFDEPVSHLDPESRAEVCTVLETLVHANRVVILLTHELSSVEKFCSKLIFLVNGQMHCCRDPEAIRQEISHEFTLVIRLAGMESGNIDFKTYTDFKSRIYNDIESATLQEERSHTLIYRISSVKYRWSNIFDILEKITNDFSSIIHDYKIRKRSLQDVFNSYARKQRVFRKDQSAWDEFLGAYC